jgi:hypothetical protein
MVATRDAIVSSVVLLERHISMESLLEEKLSGVGTVILLPGIQKYAQMIGWSASNTSNSRPSNCESGFVGQNFVVNPLILYRECRAILGIGLTASLIPREIE